MTAAKAARSLGLLGLALGFAETRATARLAALIGARGHESLLRSLGWRAIATGAGLLTSGRSRRGLASWMSYRVGGDVLDLIILLALLRANGGMRGGGAPRLLGAIGALTPLALADILCARRLRRQAAAGDARIPENVDVVASRVPAPWQLEPETPSTP